MSRDSLKDAAFLPGNVKWNTGIHRKQEIYRKNDDIRSEFARDYTRMLHCTAYRRLKHKTQVFFATQNDHICTRIEHVNHVASVSHTIASYLGLNTNLTAAIAIGHDLGHPPFGHAGETVLSNIAHEQLGDTFWHERNSLWFVDRIETLPDDENYERNLNLTYAVRDGIISHCGEIDENALKPREEAILLEDIEKANQYSPYSWEGCVVKVSDKIAYLGRDIEDALKLGILSFREYRKLRKILGTRLKDINNTIIMHDLIVDLCANSNPDSGIYFTPDHLHTIDEIKSFNFENIYNHPRLEAYKKYIHLLLTTIIQHLLDLYLREKTIENIEKGQKFTPELITVFSEWLNKYSNINKRDQDDNNLRNEIIYDLHDRIDYIRSVVDFVAGMSDQFAIRMFQEITRF